MPESQRTLHGPRPTRGAVLSRTGGVVGRLAAAVERVGGEVSIGLEPCEAHLPAGFENDIAGHERFLRTVIDATAGVAAAYKFNLAFFEALGPKGWEMMFRVRRALPAGAFVIADAKRGDIGTSAERYARALFDEFGADAATVNPLMGHDAVEPFLEHADRLTFLLVLTSNPGAGDFMLRDGLYRTLARSAAEWNGRGNVGVVVGATRPAQVREIRSIVGDMPMLIPGIGAQGGDLEATAHSGKWRVESGNEWAGMLFHVTRGVLPGKGEQGECGALIRAKAVEWRARVNRAMASADESSRDVVAEETRALLEEAGALRTGHFILSSGLHSDRYCQCAALFERPRLARRVAELMLMRLPRGFKVDVVLSPALGGVLWGYELARVLGCRNVFAERSALADKPAVAPGAFALRRGFEIRRGERVLIAEDVITTGGSVNELVPMVERAGGEVVGFAVIADRSRGAFRPGAPVYSLTTLDFQTWPADALPAHLRGVPAVKPGSRVGGGA